MGGACGTYGEEEKCIKSFGGEISGKETTWKVRVSLISITLKYMFKKWDGGIE
jgi:hypothetical protein